MESIEFQLDEGEEVIRFVSTVGNSCVPYGWIETKTSYIGLEQFSCETYRIYKTQEIEEMIRSEKLSLDSCGERMPCMFLLKTKRF